VLGDLGFHGRDVDDLASFGIDALNFPPQRPGGRRPAFPAGRTVANIKQVAICPVTADDGAMPDIVMRLAVRDLEPGDLRSCAWSGPATHLAAIARALERARLGEVEYLAACPPSGLPVGPGCWRPGRPAP
jgi:hypothetical protein